MINSNENNLNIDFNEILEIVSFIYNLRYNIGSISKWIFISNKPIYIANIIIIEIFSNVNMYSVVHNVTWRISFFVKL